MIKTVVFDLDGVVFLEEELFSQRLHRKFGVDHDDIMKFFLNDFEACLRGQADMRQVLEEKYLQKWGWTLGVDKLLELWFNNGKLNQEVVDFIHDLKKKGIVTVLCTNNEKYRTEYLSKKFSFNSLFDHIVAAYSVGSMKPEKKMFQKALELAGSSADKTVYCDDDITHVNAAKSIGFKTIHFKNFQQLKNEMSGLMANDDYSKL